MPRPPMRNRSSVQAARRLHGESLRFDSTARLPPRHMHSGATKATRLSALPAAEAWEMKVCWVEFRSSLAAAITHRVRTPIQDPGASSQNPPAQPQARASRTSLVQRGSLPWSQWLRGFRTLGCSFTALTSWSFCDGDSETFASNPNHQGRILRPYRVLPAWQARRTEAGRGAPCADGQAAC